MDKVNIGVIGCGVISDIYLKNLTQVFQNTQILAVSDLILNNAQRRAAQYNIPRVCKTNQELLAMEDIDIVVILTVPDQHANVCEAVLKAGKHVYMEKPLALNREDGLRLLALAKEKSLHLTCAPDTLLGSCIQTCRKLIHDGWIGDPVASIAIRINAGPESWHPNPAFLYKKGAGPIFDVGPYYVAGLAYMLGPVTSVQCSAKTTHASRMITSHPLYGQMIDVEVPTYATGILNHDTTITTLTLSWDVTGSRRPDHDIEIYGTQGTIVVPTFGKFSGIIYYKGKNANQWSEIPDMYPYTEDSRGIGVSDLASAIRHGRNPRLTAELAYHTLDVMLGLTDSWEQNRIYPIESSFTQTALLPLGLQVGEID